MEIGSYQYPILEASFDDYGHLLTFALLGENSLAASVAKQGYSEIP
jgi:hypothetical protein